MSDALASEHADSMVAGIRANDEAGHPFGVAGSVDYTDSTAEGEDFTAWDYLDGVLDIQYIVNSDRTYRGARVLIGFGGPNVWINTQTGNLEVSWYSPVEYRSLPSAFVEALDEALEELWEMGA